MASLEISSTSEENLEGYSYSPFLCRLRGVWNRSISESGIHVKTLKLESITHYNEMFDLVVVYTDTLRDFVLRYPGDRRHMESEHAFHEFFNSCVISHLNDIRNLIGFVASLMQNPMINANIDVDTMQVKVVVEKTTTRKKRKSQLVKRKTFTFVKSDLINALNESNDGISANTLSMLDRVYKMCRVTNTRFVIARKQPVPSYRPQSRPQVAMKRLGSC